MEWKEKLEIFLGGTFHQDIESPENAIKEYSDLWRESLLEIINAINDFANSDLSIDEKNEFIERNTEIYFPAIKKEPIVWLNEVNMFFKKKYQNDILKK
ncbi:contact-dependent growth inhibition system immunity protein [Clostridium sp. Marseille-Q2269]|uniref:contact-dependent growth inhibition system immunity protein n=1 Tax=Clostridium sp. Marseille-Q2269 TaxID=2942205 RepID=UPI0020731DC1|nr:contact-dependent growth inhibition system immunity protein [Clostridium sp. Marseille-Q2269]